MVSSLCFLGLGTAFSIPGSYHAPLPQTMKNFYFDRDPLDHQNYLKSWQKSRKLQHIHNAICSKGCSEFLSYQSENTLRLL